MAYTLQADSGVLDSWGDWDTHPVLEIGTEVDDYGGIGWPWFPGCDAYLVFDVIDGETQTTTTYKDATPTDVGDWVTAAPIAEYYDYTGVPGIIATETTQARYKIGIDFVTEFGSAFPLNQEFRVEWSEWDKDDLGAFLTQTAMSEDFTASTGTTSIETGWNTISAPGTHAYQRGVGGAFVRFPAGITRAHDSARRRKAGFYAYTLPDAPPNVFAKETVMGALPACGSEPGEDYDGNHEYDAGGTRTNNLTADTIEREYYSGIRGTSWPDIRPISPTECFKDLSFACAAEGEFKEGTVSTVLSNEVSTASIVSYVEGAVSPGSASGGGFYEDPVSIAHDYLSEDETIASRAESNWIISVDTSGFGTPPTSAINVEATVTAIDMATGEETQSTVTGSFTYPDIDETTDRNAVAEPGQWIIVGNARMTSIPSTAHSSMWLTALTAATRD